MIRHATDLGSLGTIVTTGRTAIYGLDIPGLPYSEMPPTHLYVSFLVRWQNIQMSSITWVSTQSNVCKRYWVNLKDAYYFS
jgi:hypothetical protein